MLVCLFVCLFVSSELTSWNRTLQEILIVAQLVKESHYLWTSTMDLILIQLDPFHTLTYHLSKIQFNIIFPFTLRSPTKPLPLKFSDKHNIINRSQWQLYNSS